MRIRTVKPSLWTSEDMAQLSDQAMLLAIGLLNYADDRGFFVANPTLIAAALFPLRKTAPVAELLAELVKIGYIVLSTGKDGRAYGRVATFSQHQRVSHPSPSSIEPMWQWESSVSAPGGRPEASGLKGREEEGKGIGKEAPAEQDRNELFHVEPKSESLSAPVEVVRNVRPPISDIDQLRHAGAFIGRDEAGAWQLLVDTFTLERLVTTIRKVVASGERAFRSTVAASLGHNPAKPADEYRIVDGQRVRVVRT